MITVESWLSGCECSLSARLNNCSACRLHLCPSTFTSYDTGPLLLQISPGNHFGPSLTLRTNTLWPTKNSRALQRLSWHLFCSTCFWNTWSQVEGCITSNRVRSLLFKKSSAGDTPVVECGVFRYSSSESEMAFSTYLRSPWSSFPVRRACLNV